jgi:FKBP-type peptidyl-prolyl cis-trans isomerase FkpA
MFGRRYLLWSTAVAVLALSIAACGGGDSDDSPTQPSTPPPSGPATLQITDLTFGEGTEATTGKTVIIGYILYRYDPAGADGKGEQLQSSYALGTTFPFRMYTTDAIVGMSQGVDGMKVGGKRRLTIPPTLAYGSGGNGPIRGNEWIVFEVELLAVA